LLVADIYADYAVVQLVIRQFVALGQQVRTGQPIGQLGSRHTGSEQSLRDRDQLRQPSIARDGGPGPDISAGSHDQDDQLDPARQVVERVADRLIAQRRDIEAADRSHAGFARRSDRLVGENAGRQFRRREPPALEREGIALTAPVGPPDAPGLSGQFV
jgi:hypothetical protein